jgi:hypothetical protein
MSPELDRTSARALVDAGYMPLADYITAFGESARADDQVPQDGDVPSPPTAPSHGDHRHTLIEKIAEFFH